MQFGTCSNPECKRPGVRTLVIARGLCKWCYNNPRIRKNFGRQVKTADEIDEMVRKSNRPELSDTRLGDLLGLSAKSVKRSRARLRLASPTRVDLSEYNLERMHVPLEITCHRCGQKCPDFTTSEGWTSVPVKDDPNSMEFLITCGACNADIDSGLKREYQCQPTPANPTGSQRCAPKDGREKPASTSKLSKKQRRQQPTYRPGIRVVSLPRR